jgi:hypothetical protein
MVSLNVNGKSYQADVDPRNAASIRLLERLGSEPVGCGVMPKGRAVWGQYRPSSSRGSFILRVPLVIEKTATAPSIWGRPVINSIWGHKKMQKEIIVAT